MAAQRARQDEIPPARVLRGNLAANLKNRRIAAGLTQKEFSIAANLSRDYVGQIERAVANVSIDILNHIATKLSASPIELLLPPSSKKI